MEDFTSQNQISRSSRLVLRSASNSQDVKVKSHFFILAAGRRTLTETKRIFSSVTENVFEKYVAKLPMRVGGLGLRSAVRCADVAYWASGRRSSGAPAWRTAGSVGHLPFPTPEVLSTVWPHSCSSGPSEITLRMERKCSLCFCPHFAATTSLVPRGVCEGCQAPLDASGRHQGGCSRSGRLKKRATATERALARVCREAGARVMFNVLLRDMNVDVPASDGKRIEVLAQGLPFFQ